MIPAAAYYRMSTDEQETSVPSQRTAVVPKAIEAGYKIVREYIDEGISGDETEKRAAFLRMRDDAGTGLFKAIWCWDQDRFGRFDSLEAGYWIHPLRKAGIHLVTVNEGRIDWDDFTGRVMYSLKQEGKHQYLRDLSRNTLRGMLDKAKAGKWPGGPAPFGYAIGDDETLRLGSPDAIATVRMIYDGYLSGHSLRSLAELLAAKGCRTARGNSFEYVGIRFILKNRNYTGDLHWNLRNESKYSAVRKGRVEQTPRPGDNEEADWILCAGTHPAIVSKEEFAAVQARLAGRRHASTPAKAGGRFVLSGLLRCAKCGSAMTGNTYGGNLYYVCCGYFHRGASFCLRNAVRQDELVEYVVSAIERSFLSKEAIAAAHETIRRLTVQHRPDSRTASRLADVRRELKTAERNMALSRSDGLRERYERIVGELAEREAVLSRQQSAEAASRQCFATIRQKLDDSIDRAKDLRRLVNVADAMHLREVLHQVIDRIEVRVKVEPRQKRKRFFLEGGTISLNSENLLASGRYSKQVLLFRAG